MHLDMNWSSVRQSSQTHLSVVMKAAKRDIEYSQFAFHSSRAGLKDSVRAQLQCRSSLRQPNLALDCIGLLSAAYAQQQPLRQQPHLPTFKAHTGGELQSASRAALLRKMQTPGCSQPLVTRHRCTRASSSTHGQDECMDNQRKQDRFLWIHVTYIQADRPRVPES